MLDSAYSNSNDNSNVNFFPVEILGDQVEVPDVCPEGKGLARFSGTR